MMSTWCGVDVTWTKGEKPAPFSNILTEVE